MSPNEMSCSRSSPPALLEDQSDADIERRGVGQSFGAAFGFVVARLPEFKFGLVGDFVGAQPLVTIDQVETGPRHIADGEDFVKQLSDALVLKPFVRAHLALGERGDQRLIDGTM